MRVATVVVFLVALPALASAQTGPCTSLLPGFDPYKPSHLAVLRQLGSGLLAHAPPAALLQLDPYVPTQAWLLRQYGGAVPAWPFLGFPAYVQTAYPPDCTPIDERAVPEPPASDTPPITTFAELLTRLPQPPASQAATPPSGGGGASVVSVEPTLGAWIAFDGRRWISAGRAVPFDEAGFVRVGDSGASAVFRAKGATDEMIFIPTTPGMVAPFRAVSR